MTLSPRPHPFELIFGELAGEHFPVIREALGAGADLDHFLMAEPAITLLQALRPDEGLGEGQQDFMVFVHAAWSFWCDGCETVSLDLEQSKALCTAPRPATSTTSSVRYIQIAPRLIWGSLDGGEHYEPLDGWFVLPAREGRRVVAVFGLHPDRPGLSVLVAEGEVSDAGQSREDGTALFAPTMSGGDVAGLYSVASLEELLLLAQRVITPGEDV